MTLTIDRVTDETAGLSSPASMPDQRMVIEESGAQGPVPEDLFQRAQKLAGQLQSRAIERTVLLGLLLAELDGVPFEAVAELLDTKPPKLLKMMHGLDQVPAAKERRWEAIAVSIQNL